VLLNEGMQKAQDDIFVRSHEEIGKALAAASNFPDACFVDGRALAQLSATMSQASFEKFVKGSPRKPNRGRISATISRP